MESLPLTNLLKKQQNLGEQTYIQGHYYQKSMQAGEYSRQIENLEDEEILVHVDYSENHKNKLRNKTKAAYYCHGNFSLYTAVRR